MITGIYEKTKNLRARSVGEIEKSRGLEIPADFKSRNFSMGLEIPPDFHFAFGKSSDIPPYAKSRGFLFLLFR